MSGWLKQEISWSGGKRHQWFMPVGPYVATLVASRWGWDFVITRAGRRPERVGSWQERRDAARACEARLTELLAAEGVASEQPVFHGNLDRFTGCSKVGRQCA